MKTKQEENYIISQIKGISNFYSSADIILADAILLLKDKIDSLESEVERLKHPKGYELVNEHELTDK